MDKELEILKLADYYEEFKINDAHAYLIINKKIKEHPCMFGFVTLPNDFNTSQELFNKIEAKAKQLGYKDIIGPLNYTTWMSYRFATNNFDFKLYPDCTNPKYYVDFVKKLGYQELYTYRSAYINMKNKLYDIGELVYKEKLKEGYEFKTFIGEEAYDLAKDVYNISIDAFEGSYLYSEIPFECFEQIYLEWTKKIKLILIVAYKDDKAIGYVMGYENPFSKDFISKTSAVLKSYQKHKVYVALLYLGCKYVLNLGYDKMIYHFQCEQRETFQRFDKMIESNEKNYAIYIKEL